MRQGMDQVDLDSRVTKLLDHYTQQVCSMIRIRQIIFADSYTI